MKAIHAGVLSAWRRSRETRCDVTLYGDAHARPYVEREEEKREITSVSVYVESALYRLTAEQATGIPAARGRRAPVVMLGCRLTCGGQQVPDIQQLL